MSLFVYFKMIKLIRISFNPGCSAYTFPLVIRALGTLKFAGYLSKSANSWTTYVKQFGLIELYIAILVVAYVSLGYLFLFLKPKKSNRISEKVAFD